jgi:hypothetical protein
VGPGGEWSEERRVNCGRWSDEGDFDRQRVVDRARVGEAVKYIKHNFLR